MKLPNYYKIYSFLVTIKLLDSLKFIAYKLNNHILSYFNCFLSYVSRNYRYYIKLSYIQIDMLQI